MPKNASQEFPVWFLIISRRIESEFLVYYTYMHAAYHHVLKRKHHKEKSSAGFDIKSFMDKLVYVSTCFGVAANIPQLTQIWINKRIEGVSLITWIGFLLGSSFWLLYGIIHKEKPIIITNGLFVTIQFFIVLGLLLQHVSLAMF